MFSGAPMQLPRWVHAGQVDNNDAGQLHYILFLAYELQYVLLAVTNMGVQYTVGKLFMSTF